MKYWAFRDFNHDVVVMIRGDDNYMLNEYWRVIADLRFSHVIDNDVNLYSTQEDEHAWFISLEYELCPCIMAWGPRPSWARAGINWK